MSHQLALATAGVCTLVLVGLIVWDFAREQRAARRETDATLRHLPEDLQ